MERLPPRFWEGRGRLDRTLALALWPCSLLYRSLAALHGTLGRRAARRAPRFGVPLVVIGNLRVGGSGKTPLVLWLATRLSAAGYHPGIVSRGYGGSHSGGGTPRLVTADSDAATVGDEPLLLARRSGCPVAVGADRSAAVRLLLGGAAAVDIVISDDGLQHYRMARDLEIIVMDGARGLGNGMCLPAGPLREPPSRLARADFSIVHGEGDGAAGAGAGDWHFTLKPERFINLANPDMQRPPDSFAAASAHAVAGVGHPQRFFASLAALGINAQCHPFPDHHSYRPGDLQFEEPWPLLMTEKDAVKCAAFAAPDWWYLQVRAAPDEGFAEALLQAIQALRR